MKRYRRVLVQLPLTTRPKERRCGACGDPITRGRIVVERWSTDRCQRSRLDLEACDDCIVAVSVFLQRNFSE